MVDTKSAGAPARRSSHRFAPEAVVLLTAFVLVGGATPKPTYAQAAPNRTSEAGAQAANARPAPTTDQPSRLVYSVNRTPEQPFDTARAVQVITGEDIWRKNARTLPELLMNETGIFVQQTNYGGGSPIIRGLMGKQVLILVDGVRLNNATFRFGPLQYLNTIDLSAVERIEIVRGVESVLGSDGLAGLINIVLKKGPAAGATQAVGGAVTTRFSSNDDAATVHGEVFGRTSRLRYTFGATSRQMGDYRIGGGLGTQTEAGYDEWAASMGADYRVSAARTVAVRYHTLSQDKVPGASRSAATSYLVNDPQSLHLFTAEYQDLTKQQLYDQLQVTAYVNKQEEGQLEIRSTALNVERENWDSDAMLGASLQMASFLPWSQRLIYGFDYTRERIRSYRTDVNVATGTSTLNRGKFTDRATYGTAAVYVQDRFNLTRWLTPSFGARYGYTSAAGTENSKVAVLDLGSSQTGLTGSASLVAHVYRTINLVASVTRGFRPPNIDDLSRYDERSGSSGIEIPNPALNPERSFTYEFGMKVDSARFEGSGFYYHSDLRDLHDRRPGTFEGLSYFDLNDNGVRDASDPPVLQRVNVGKATIRGVELDGRVRLLPALTLEGNFSSTRGHDHVLDEPLSRIPPRFGTLKLRFTPDVSRRLWSEAWYSIAAAQRHVSTRDKGDVRIGPLGTDGFDVFGLRGGFDVARQVRISLGVENVADTAYKYHTSGIMRPGRQFVLGTDFRF